MCVMNKLKVIKWNGVKQEYDPEKILDTLDRYGVTGREAEEMLAEVEPRLVPGIRTSKVLRLLHHKLDEKEKMTPTAQVWQRVS